MKTAVQKLTFEERLANKIKETMPDLVSDEELLEITKDTVKNTLIKLVDDATKYSGYGSNNEIRNKLQNIANSLIIKVVDSIKEDKELMDLIFKLFIAELPNLISAHGRDLVNSAFNMNKSITIAEIENRYFNRHY